METSWSINGVHLYVTPWLQMLSTSLLSSKYSFAEGNSAFSADRVSVHWQGVLGALINGSADIHIGSNN